MTDKGTKISSTIRNKNGILYIFENKNGKKVTFDGFNAFARTIGVDAGNLYRTFKHKNYWCKDWKLTEILNLCKPNWNEINNKLKSCKVIERISKKIDDVKKGILKVRTFGRKIAQASYLPIDAALEIYRQVKEEEAIEEAKKIKLYGRSFRPVMTEKEYQDMLEGNLAAYEANLTYF